MARTKNFTLEDKRALLLMLEELNSRNVKLPDESAGFLKKKNIVWPVDENGYFIKKDGTLYNATEAQAGFISSSSRFSLYFGGRGSGKALALDTPILTADGWKDMKNMSVGDRVFGSDGLLHDVVDVSDIMYNHSCYEVWFDDNTHIVADGEHLWETETTPFRKALSRRKTKSHAQHRKFKRIFTTEEISDSLMYGKERNHSIPIVDKLVPEYTNVKDLAIDPYILGYWLGDGTSSRGEITVGEEDCEYVLQEFSKRGYFPTSKNGLSYRLQYKNEISQKRNNLTGRIESNPKSFVSQLRILDLIDNKHLPDKVLLSRTGYRLQVIQGLMDSDGSISEEGKAEFCTTSLELADGFLSLCYSLGIKVGFRKGKVMFDGRDFVRYRFSFIPRTQLFRIPRKAVRTNLSPRTQTSRRKRRFIKKVIPVNSVPVKCISIDSDDHLYLAGKSLIATHNSCAGGQKALRKIMAGENGAVINPLFSDFKDSTWKEFKQWIPWDLVVAPQKHRANDEWQPSQPFTMVFENGATVMCKGLKNPDSARGPNINWLWYDESRNDLTGMAWKMAIASVRVGKNPQAWTTTTPMGMSHWLYEFFIEKDLPDVVLGIMEKEGISMDSLISSFKGSINDNKENLDPGFYVSILSSYPSGWLKDREVDGDFAEEGGKIGDARWFTANDDGENKIIKEPLPDQTNILRYWDLAATEKKQAKNDPDEMVGTLLSKHKGKENDKPLFCIQNQIGGHWGDKKAIEVIANVARADGPLITVMVEQEPGASGKITVAAVQEYFKRFPELQAHTVKGLDVKKVGDRVLAANLLWFSVAQEGRMYMMEGAWNKETLKQIDGFTQVVHDDRVTSITNGMFELNPYKVWKKSEFMTL